MCLAIIQTHPIQYHAPVYRCLQQDLGIPVTVCYGSDFSVAGYRDREFGTEFAWDTDLLSGYTSHFLARSMEGGARSAEQTSARNLGNFLSQIGPAAVLLTGYSPRFYRQALWKAWRFGRPILFRAETTDHARSRSPLKRAARDAFLKWVYGRCAALLYVGQQSRRHFVRLGCPESKLTFSPYCVPTDHYPADDVSHKSERARVRAELDLAEDRCAALFCGKLVPRKGPDLLIEAVRRLPQELQKKLTVMFLGDGELRSSLNQLADGASPVDCRFIGFQNQTRLGRYYHAADFLVLPSRESETWGLVVNEALHHGLPCVVSDNVGCAPDLITSGETGEIFAAGSTESLGAALERVIQRVGREETERCCKARVASYSVRAAAEGIAQAYWKVVGSKIDRRNERAAGRNA
jgi:glycosyltransferase involved in cell wall biosynthesis